MDLQSIDTVLFDLDGTLADTAPDMAGAVNRLLEEEGHPALPLSELRSLVSKGGAALVGRAFGALTDDEEILEKLRLRFLDIYHANVCIDTVLFPGMDKVIDFIESNSMRWGIVTNKPGWLTQPLLVAMGLDHRPACVVSGDTLAKRKPDPEPLWHACELAGSEASQCVYVGDDARDIQAGNAAGMPTLIARYGYIGNERPEEWGAHGGIDQPEDLIPLLGRHA